MIKKIAVSAIAAAALGLSLAPLASADTTPAPKPDPLSAAGLCHCKIPTLSVGGLTQGHEYTVPPLSAKGIVYFWQNGKFHS